MRMRLYREFLIYLLKALSHGIFLYSCIFILSSVFLTTIPNRVLLPMGIITVLLSLILCSVSSRYQKTRPLEKYFFLIGAVFSLIISFISYEYIQHSSIILVLSVPYYMYLWRLGWDLGSMRLSHEEFKYQFMLQFKILLALTVASAFFPITAYEMGQYFTAFVIINPIILRYSRDHNLMREQKNKKAYLINILSTAGMVLLLLFVSSTHFIASMSLIINFISIGADKVLTFIIYVISYPIGYIINLIIILLQKLLKPNASILDKLKPGDENNVQQPLDISVVTIPPAVLLALKIAIPVILAVILIKALSRYAARTVRKDFSETRESVFSLTEMGKGIRKSLSSILKRKNKTKPETISEKIRFLYISFLELSIGRGIYKKSSQTVRDIKEKSLLLAGVGFKDVEYLTDIYEKTRYGEDCPSQADLDSAEYSLEKIKEEFDKVQ